MNIQDMFDGLSRDENGVYSTSSNSAISYPSDQNERCRQFEEASFWFKHRNQCIIQTVKNFPPQGEIVDIGGGNGYVSMGLQNAGFDPIVLEPGKTGALNSLKRGINKVICSTFQDAQPKSGTLNAAGMFDVIEHIEDDLSFLGDLNESLREGGRLYLSVPAYNFLWSQVDKDAGHYRRYTKRSMKRVLEHAGFEIEYSTYIFTILPIPIFLFRSIPSFFGKSKRHEEISETKEKEHTKRSNILDSVWKLELKAMSRSQRIPFGGTLLVVASKK